MEELFKPILDDDENVLACLKPNKKRFILINNLATIILGLIFLTPVFIIGILGLIGTIVFEGNDKTGPIFMVIIAGIILLGFLFSLFSRGVVYKNTAYAVTNKRVLIRSGFVGVDYKSIDLSSIHSINVRVDFADKLVKPETGSISFASALDPLTNNNGKSGVTTFTFSHIEHPYDEYKRIKQLSDELKKNK